MSKYDTAALKSSYSSEFFSGLQTIWHKTAPGAVRKAFRSGKVTKGWEAWVKHVTKRERPLGLGELLPGEESPLLWALPDDLADSDSPALIRRICRLASESGSSDGSPEGLVLEWLHDHLAPHASASYAVEALTWAYSLPLLAEKVPAELWYGLLEHLLVSAIDQSEIGLNESPVVNQILAGELPLALGYLLPEITACRKLGPQARRALSAGLVDLLDGEGLPHADHLGLSRCLLACWTRCRAIGNESKEGCWSKPAQTQYEWLVREALRLTRHDGTQVFSKGSSGDWSPELFGAALRLAGDEDDGDIAALVLPGSKKSKLAKISETALPEAAIHSEWAAVAILRSGWRQSAPMLAATYPETSVRIELQSGRESLFSGEWGLEVSCDGHRAECESEWEEVCWISDDDADYLELEIELADGLRVQRHILLAREDNFLFLADAVLGGRPAELEYRSRLPLGNDISFQAAQESREGVLVGKEQEVPVFPLAQPEWRATEHSGSLSERSRHLELCRSSKGRAMFAPLFIDLCPGRFGHHFTWRQLTVAEQLEIQPQDVAVGYRVTIGKQQWLIYRSLAKSANRTLLGHNLSSEMLVARFGRDGEVQTLVQIE